MIKLIQLYNKRYKYNNISMYITTSNKRSLFTTPKVLSRTKPLK